MKRIDRRRFVTGTSVAASMASLGTGVSSLLATLPQLRAEDVRLADSIVRYRDEIEPLVRLLEETQREQIIDKVMGEISSGRTYRELLAALFLAGIRNVQPRPAVGFKFHCVLVVYATHQASVAASDRERWLPLLWAIDNFKGAQATDVREGNWTMAKVDEAKVPTAEKSLSALSESLDKWDVEAADAAAAGAARSATRSQLFDLLSKYAARDFRSIGHKAIYVSAAFRALDVIGWEHAEPIIRSLAYAILNHQGEENPSQHDYAADRAGRSNWSLVQSWNGVWNHGQRDPKHSRFFVDHLRSATPETAAQGAIDSITREIHPRTLRDGIALRAAELVMQQPGIVPLHAITTTNAIEYMLENVSDEKLRKWLLLQNCSFLAHFAEAARSRGDLKSANIDQLFDVTNKTTSTVEEAFEQLGKNKMEGATTVSQLAQDPAKAREVVAHARHLIFLKGTDAHDYKFSSAALEDFQGIHPELRSAYLGACSHLFKTASDKTSELSKRVLS